MDEPPDPLLPAALLLALDALLARAHRLDAAGQPDAALALLDEAHPALHASATFHYARGSLRFRLGDHDGAIASFREAVALAPEIPEYRANLGAALLEKARGGDDWALVAEALDELGRAVAWGPKTALPHNNLGLALQATGRLDGALAAFDAGLAIEPHNLAAMYNRAATLKLLGRTDESRAALDELLRVSPSFEPAVAARDELRRTVH